MTNDPVQRLAEHAAARDAWLAATSGQLRGDERVDPSYAPPQLREWSEEERAQRLAEPDVPSSDVSTFIGLDDLRYRLRHGEASEFGRQG